MLHFLSVWKRHKKILFLVTIVILFLFSIWELAEVHFLHERLSTSALHYVYMARGILMSLFMVTLIVFLLEKQGSILTRMQQETIIQKDALEDLSEKGRLKSEALKIASHDLKSPLTILGLHIDAIEADLAGSASDRQKKILARSKATLSKSFKLIDEVINTELIEQGVVTLNKTPINIRKLLENEINEYCSQRAHRNIEWQWNCPENLSLIAADEKQIRHLFYNISSNICDNSPSNGKVHLEITEHPNKITLCIKNNSVDSKGQTSNPYAIKHGIGLSICSQICKLHGFSFETKKDTETFTTRITFLK